MNYRSFAIRTLVAVLFGPLVILTALTGHWYWLAFISLVALLSVFEFYKLAEKKAGFGHYSIGLFMAVAIVISFYFLDELGFLSIILIGVPRHVFCRDVSQKRLGHAQHGDSIFRSCILWRCARLFSS